MQRIANERDEALTAHREKMSVEPLPAEIAEAAEHAPAGE
jgi:hypothetical protein